MMFAPERQSDYQLGKNFSKRALYRAIVFAFVLYTREWTANNNFYREIVKSKKQLHF